ncbi:ABC transporter ATP-binding protein [Defluviimonas sp. WL0050]|nr:ABC transporter ATP-binding protein [Defluviimonas sp. WL0050]
MAMQRALAPDPVPDAPHLGVHDLSWGPKGAPDILHDLSFALQRDQVLAVCGPNGAGKSTLLRLIYRYLTPRLGQVLLSGVDLHALPRRETARRVAAVVQEQPTDFALTVREMVSLGRLPHRDGLSGASAHDAEIVAAALRQLDLTRFAETRFDRLSGGERQRVMIARALAQEPELLVLDEPTNHLDIRHQLELLALLRQLGLTVVLTLHDLTLAAEFADRLLVLAGGRKLAEGSPAEILTPETIAHAFNVSARIDRSGGTPRFSFHL